MVLVTAFPSVFAAAFPATAFLVAVAVASASAADIAPPPFLPPLPLFPSLPHPDLAAAVVSAAAEIVAAELAAAVISAAAALSAAASTHLAADFKPGPEGVAEGSAAGQGVGSLRLAPPTLVLSLRRRRRGGLRDGASAVCVGCYVADCA